MAGFKMPDAGLWLYFFTIEVNLICLYRQEK
jgi:hypothetical protein